MHLCREYNVSNPGGRAYASAKICALITQEIGTLINDEANSCITEMFNYTEIIGNNAFIKVEEIESFFASHQTEFEIHSCPLELII